LVPLTNNVGADQPNRTSRGPEMLGPRCSRKPDGSTPASQGIWWSFVHAFNSLITADVALAGADPPTLTSEW